MKVSITEPGATASTPIAGETWREMPSGLKVNSKRVIDVAEFLGGLYAKARNRKNTRNTVSFSVYRLHETIQDAERFILGHEASLPDWGVVRFTCPPDTGGSAGADFYFTAGLESIDLVMHCGITTVWSYSFVGGRIST